jgi:hypothetical protein
MQLPPMSSSNKAQLQQQQGKSGVVGRLAHDSNKVAPAVEATTPDGGGGGGGASCSTPSTTDADGPKTPVNNGGHLEDVSKPPETEVDAGENKKKTKKKSHVCAVL